MGGSQSCSLCPDDSAKTKREVLVMKEDGEPMKFKKGILVKDVLAANPYHKVIRCCSDRSILPESFQLNGNSLYFLLPEGLAVNDATYKSLIRAAVSKELIISQLVIDKSEIDGQEAACKVVIASDGDDDEYKKSHWKPTLQTIQEATSSPLNADI